MKENLRNRQGRYAAECTFCDCPDGCGCDGEGCACGTKKKLKGVELRKVMLLESVEQGHRMTKAQYAFCLDVLAPTGLIDVSGTWKLTSSGKARLDANRDWFLRV